MFFQVYAKTALLKTCTQILWTDLRNVNPLKSKFPVLTLYE